MRLRHLFKEIPSLQIRGSQEIKITGITASSKHVGPGSLFIVKRGNTFDGSKFIPEAIASGAIALLSDTYDPFLEHVTQIIHPHPASLELLLAQRFYQHPTQKLQMIGVTGTNGKTTTTYLIKYLLEKRGPSCGLIGTVAWMTGTKVYPPTHTTPDTLTLMRLFSEMVQEKVSACAMEVTSHALHQKRVQGIDFQVAVFTNLSQDHLDYHLTMENYAAAKALLFSSLAPSSCAIVNRDDPASAIMIQASKARLMTYGLTPEADLYASDLQMSARSMEFTVHFKGESLPFKTPMIGRFNVYNILAAAGVALIQGMTLSQIRDALATFTGVPGRLERVLNPKDLQVFVDYSHTPDALEKALKTLHELNSGRIITVYGCGGNRDATKRPIMGSIAEKLSDVAILTSDNPRNEDPLEIATQVLQGCEAPQKTILELDRQKAIQRAVELATPQDIILIAGKGHETTQTFAHRTIHFDDRLVAKQACESLV